MFGLTARERLIKTIQNASVNSILSYKNSIIEIVQEGEAFDDDATQEALADYHRGVLEAVSAVFDASSPNIHARFSLVTTSPGLCGHEIEPGRPHMAGSVYAMAYWAMTNRAAKVRDCVALNHWQAAIIDNAILEAGNELGATMPNSETL